MNVIYKSSFQSIQSEYQLELRERSGSKEILLERHFYSKQSPEPSEGITIHPKILNELISQLIECSEKLNIPFKHSKTLTPTQRQEIQRRYLRGISIKDLCIQFDSNLLGIERVLLDAGIELVDLNYKKPYRYWHRKNYKK
ncbi:hypothetical protein [Christiangramia forsetii]|uniref:Uncharacterized protein n=2 Tax=Christiangramia forsetii TaxID=411153 RepID=A0M4K6_CHRFK|nr:hypothetical protein [Christiangramia forsetii]GGG23220.1 hypothetical protein GCM10011532_02920 [Christiangramia forsetii]CAL67551.1 hypothetical protein GFO_2595 [Christiangramia forsetii KT0803]